MDLSATMWGIVVVLVVGGVLGGAVNHLIGGNATKDEPSWALGTAILAGLAAAATVPLALNMIASDMIQKIIEKNDIKSAFKDLALLFGFAVVVALAARRFLNTMADKLIKQVADAKLEAKAAKKEASEAKTAADTAVVTATDAKHEAHVAKDTATVAVEAGSEPEPTEASPAAAADIVGVLDQSDQKILRAMAEGHYPLRSISGLAKETGLERPQINQRLSSLISRGLVDQVTREKGPRWYITSQGRALIGSY